MYHIIFSPLYPCFITWLLDSRENWKKSKRKRKKSRSLTLNVYLICIPLWTHLHFYLLCTHMFLLSLIHSLSNNRFLILYLTQTYNLKGEPITSGAAFLPVHNIEKQNFLVLPFATFWIDWEYHFKICVIHFECIKRMSVKCLFWELSKRSWIEFCFEPTIELTRLREISGVHIGIRWRPFNGVRSLIIEMRSTEHSRNLLNLNWLH